MTTSRNAPSHPARAVWFDLAVGRDELLEAGATHPAEESGFLWVDLELSDPGGLAALETSGHLPPRVIDTESPDGVVAWHAGAGHVHFAFAGAHMRSGSLVLDRRHLVVGRGVVTSVHRGQPDYLERVRSRYVDTFAAFAKSHGFLIFEMAGLLIDDLQEAVRDLGDRIDELRLAATPSSAGRPPESAELLAAVLLLRRILVGTRDVLVEAATRRSEFVPETTQPYLRDLASRIDGTVDDLAFSRGVLAEAMSEAAAVEATVPAPVATQEPTPTSARGKRPALHFVGLGSHAVHRDGKPVPDGDFGAGRGRELLTALLAARGAVGRGDLIAAFWPDLDAERGGRALDEAVRRVLEVLAPDDPPSLIADVPDGHRLMLGADDSWDIAEILEAPVRAAEAGSAMERVEMLAAALAAASEPIYPEWPDAPWLAGLRRDFAGAILAVRGALAEALLAAGDPAAALAHFQTLLDGDPEREAWHRGVMRCHAARGDRPLALRQYHACRSVLRQTQGAEPSPETQGLYLDLMRPAR